MTRYVLFISNGGCKLTATSSKKQILQTMFKSLRERLKENCFSVLVYRENAFGCIDKDGNSREIKYEEYTFVDNDPYKHAYTL